MIVQLLYAINILTMFWFFSEMFQAFRIRKDPNASKEEVYLARHKIYLTYLVVMSFIFAVISVSILIATWS